MIELPWPPSSLSGHSDKHFWRMRPIIAKHREWARRAALAAGLGPFADTGDIRVSATFYPPDRRTDRVNMPTRLKPYWDGIADALKVNDRRFLPAYHFAEPVENPRVVVTISADCGDQSTVSSTPSPLSPASPKCTLSTSGATKSGGA